MLTHSGVKAHTCSECAKSFGLAKNLRRHMIIHTGEKIHKCAKCGDSFGQAANLKSHTLTHSGEEPHNAILYLHEQAISETTSKHIPQRSQINANGATSLQSQNEILPDMCSPTVERSHITVKSAEAHSAEQKL